MHIKLFLIAAIVFLLIDSIWLSLVANSFYKDQLGSLLKDKPNLIAAAVFYLIFVIAILVFAVAPADTVLKAALLGGFFGFAAYATYDLTNLATLKNWPIKIVVIDMAWGTFLTGSVAAITKILS